jgi:hypothetical protein
MLSPGELQNIADSLVEIYENIEDDLLKNIAGRFSVLDEITPDTVAEWQTKKLLQLGALRKENLSLIAKHSGKAEKDIERLLKEAGYKALSFDEQIYQQAFAAGLLDAAPLPVHSSIDIQRLLTAAINNAKQTLNLINTTALESANQEFLKVINQVYLETSLGISDYNTAMRKAVRGLSDMGITGANYISDRGKRTRNHIDVAVKRAVNTSAFQTAAKMQIQRANEWGAYLVEVTSHMGARPSHAAWQGHIYSLVGGNSKYPSLSDSTGYGTVTGLCGANCKHHFYPYFEGISERAYEPYGKKENQKAYEESQQQRQLERDIRQQKRRALTAEASGDAEGLLDAQLTLKAKEAELKDFLKKTGRTKRGNRQQVLNFGHSNASQAVQADSKAYVQRFHKKGLEISLKDIAKHRNLRYTNFPEYELQNKYLRSVNSGLLSPLSGYDNYKALHDRVEKELVGIEAVNGLHITGQSDHFLERVIGTTSDPTHGNKPRSGVKFEALVDTLKNGSARPIKMTKDKRTGTMSQSQTFVGKLCDVSVNPLTGILIQCNP